MKNYKPNQGKTNTSNFQKNIHVRVKFVSNTYILGVIEMNMAKKKTNIAGT